MTYSLSFFRIARAKYLCYNIIRTMEYMAYIFIRSMINIY